MSRKISGGCHNIQFMMTVITMIMLMGENKYCNDFGRAMWYGIWGRGDVCGGWLSKFDNALPTVHSKGLLVLKFESEALKGNRNSLL